MTVGSISYAVERKLLQEGAFIATTDFVQVDTLNEYPFLFFRNPSDSELRALITHISWGLDSNSARSIVRIYRNPTISADGTAIASQNTYLKTSPVEATLEVYREPTVTDNGTLLLVQSTPANTASRGLQRYLLMNKDQSVLVTLQNSVTGCDTFSELTWVEI